MSTMGYIKNIPADVGGGIALLAATLAAILFVSLGNGDLYHHILEYPLSIGIAPFVIEKTIHHWINDGLMVLFFLLVGIEIKHEFREGELRGLRRAAPPIISAIAGFIIPAAIYMAFNSNSFTTHSGWSIPTATDIAFVVAIISVLRAHVPPALRAFIIALAVIDDLMAIIVIALFYTQNVIWMNLVFAGIAGFLIYAKNKLGMRHFWIYIVMGFAIWLGVLNSGVHATLAGVWLGLLLPIHGDKKGSVPPAKRMEKMLEPWVRWLVVPLFAFANAGIDLSQLNISNLVSPVTLGIALGLFFGKQIGIFCAVWLLEHLKIAKRPEGTNWQQIYGAATLCGIGFTMSLFIGALALPQEYQGDIRLGVLIGSIFSTLLGIAIIYRGKARA
ncbi:MAG TPA: Na+/H+ antiporter NhaA [Alphaproteobacteria bacterium]|nr:Na+/H+ antiporter NhaA [Alphaproteobacteria bacterium]